MGNFLAQLAGLFLFFTMSALLPPHAIDPKKKMTILVDVRRDKPEPATQQFNDKLREKLSAKFVKRKTLQFIGSENSPSRDIITHSFVGSLKSYGDVRVFSYQLTVTETSKVIVQDVIEFSGPADVDSLSEIIGRVIDSALKP